MEHLVHRRRNRKFVEFHEQAILLVQAELRRRFFQRFDIFRIEMKIAASGDLEAIADSILQFVARCAHAREIETVFGVRVRSCDDVRDAIGDGTFRHGERLFDRLCAIVDPRKNVAMQVNHVGASSASPCSERLPCAEQEKKRGKYLAHATRFDPSCDFRSEDAAEKQPWNQKDAS